MKLSSKYKSLDFPAILFYLFVFTFPCNLAKHFVGDYSYINGRLVDYYVPAFYISLIPLTVSFLLVLIAPFYRERLLTLLKTNYLLTFIVTASFTYILFFDVLPSSRVVPSLYRYLLLLAGLIVFLLFKVIITNKDKYKLLILTISFSAFLSGLLALLQFVRKAPLLPYRFLGETQFQLYNPQVAKIILGDSLFVRAYGPFPHPNILGGYLAITFLLVLFSGAIVSCCPTFVLLRESHSINKSVSCKQQIPNYCYSTEQRFLMLIFATIIFIALLLTFSRTATVLLILVTAIYTLIIGGGRRIITAKYYLITALFLLIGALVFYTPRFSESLGERGAQIIYALSRINSPFGYGLNTYSLQASKFSFQPVHNIFILALYEGGAFVFLILLSLLSYLFYASYKKNSARSLLLMSALVLLGTFDHYLLTIYQGIVLFSLTVGVVSDYTQRDGTTAGRNLSF